MTELEIETEVAEVERETRQRGAESMSMREAALRAMSKDMRYDARNRARQTADSPAKVGAVPPWLTAEHCTAIIAMYQQSVELGEATGVPHSVDHVVPFGGVCRKTWRATGERKQVVCGLHVAWNLRAIPQGTNREIKRDWFDSDWPVDGERAKATRFDDDDIPF